MTTVMVVDDHTMFRQGVVNALNGVEGYEVVAEASSGAAAVRLAKDLRPDVVVMDISMPDIDGIEAARRIRGASIESRIILLTMLRGSEFLDMAESAGIQGYLLKDDALSDLVYAIKAVCRGEKFTSASLVREMASQSRERSAPSGLSKREREVITLVVKGLSSKEIADHLFISVKTVESHRARIMEKTGAKNLPELVRYAIRAGLIQA
ncbi:MAG: DNA-binding response regulator [Acidobacteria bacterium]|nr:MAG: DNA-binding response regulator [Acidobacteriota bacterium]